MLDKVPYDVYVTDPRPFSFDMPSNSVDKDGLSAMDRISEGQQVVVIFKSNLRKDSPWVQLIRDKICVKRLNMYKKNKKFKIRCEVHESPNPHKRLRQNVHLVIERVL